MTGAPSDIDVFDSRSAYAYVLGQYLGDGCISEHRRSVFRLRITCADDWPLVTERVAESLSILMPGNAVCYVAKQGCTEVSMYSERWPALVPQHGAGRKHLRSLRLAAWQEDLVFGPFADEFLCGLIHSDGCRSTNRVTVRGKSYEYPRYFFSNRSEDIHAMFATALECKGLTSTRSGWMQSVAR